jgi:hypothetical protein
MNHNDPTVSWYTLKEAASILHKSYIRTHALVQARRLGAVQCGRKGRILVSSKHIEDFLRRWELRATSLSHHNKADGLEIPSLINS